MRRSKSKWRLGIKIYCAFRCNCGMPRCSSSRRRARSLARAPFPLARRSNSNVPRVHLPILKFSRKISLMKSARPGSARLFFDFLEILSRIWRDFHTWKKVETNTNKSWTPWWAPSTTKTTLLPLKSAAVELQCGEVSTLIEGSENKTSWIYDFYHRNFQLNHNII